MIEKPYFRTAFSEDDGSGSFGRLMSGILISFVIMWVTWHSYLHGLPPGAEVVLYVTAALLPYTASKAASTIKDIKTGNGTPPPTS